ncbi:MAG: Succinyl-CoA ligase (ADP-forming) subunit alpha [Syntrophaceae bacterium PtaU1.Bin231]|nr:MAG: Succinyl-CoA ligase (ADP-forming) subunit alpha [Syntrophaceae bacterium PtaU1.Bin231]
MSIILQEGTSVMIQGITGRFGQFVARNMLDNGTNVVAGVTPGKAGQRVWDIPVYDTVREAWDTHGPIETALIVVPGPEARTALMETVGVPFKNVLMEIERVPLHDSLACIAACKRAGIRLIGPGSGGIVCPGKGTLGLFGSPEMAEIAFHPGRIGVISRSGGQTSTLSYEVCKAGFGISTAVNLGSESVLGTTFSELLPLFQEDAETDAVVYYGEIGGVMEEEAADLMRAGGYRKPLVAYIAGRGLPAGIRFSHASAIIEGGRGTAEGKVGALKGAGAHVVDNPADIGSTLKKIFLNVTF